MARAGVSGVIHSPAVRSLASETHQTFVPT